MADNDHGNELLPLPKRSLRTSIELPIFINTTTVNLTGAVINNIILYRTCVHSLDHTVDECKFFLSPIKANENSDLEVEVQKYFSYITIVKTVLEFICPIILSIFLGSWSDKYGRKPLIVWPLFGMSMSGILLVFFAKIESIGPWWFVLTAIAFSITGGFVILLTGAYCYVSDTSSPNNRAFRMIFLDASSTLGYFTGAMLSSYLIALMGNVYLLLLTAALNVTALAFSKFCLVESLNGALQNGASQIFDFSNARQMFRECFKKRRNHGRSQIIVITIVRLLLSITSIGISDLEYLYTRNKLHWDLRDYTIYSAVCTVIAFLGSFIGIVLLQKLLRLGDIAVTIIAILSSVVDYLIKLFAVDYWEMYLSSSISLSKGVTGPLLRTYITKFLPMQDIAKVFALLSATESLAIILGPVIFNSLYSFTLAELPGAIFILGSVMNTACMVMLILVQYYS